MIVRFTRSFLTAITLLSLIGCPAFSQTEAQAWQKVQQRIGAPVIVITKAGQRLEGSLSAATDEALTIKSQAQTQEVKKLDIAEVRIKKKSRGNKAAWIGGLAAVGFGIGAAIGKAANPDDDAGLGSFGPWIGGAIGAAGGAVTGAIIASQRGKPTREEIIYKAP